MPLSLALSFSLSLSLYLSIFFLSFLPSGSFYHCLLLFLSITIRPTCRLNFAGSESSGPMWPCRSRTWWPVDWSSFLCSLSFLPPTVSALPFLHFHTTQTPSLVHKTPHTLPIVFIDSTVCSSVRLCACPWSHRFYLDLSAFPSAPFTVLCLCLSQLVTFQWRHPVSLVFWNCPFVSTSIYTFHSLISFVLFF